MRILFAADVAPDPDSGAAGTEWQTIAALRRQGHEVHTIWRENLPQRIRHGNLHYLLELPRGYRRVIRRHCQHHVYDVIHVNQSHGYLAAEEHQRLGRRGVFVMRSHGLDDHMEAVLRPWRQRLGIPARRGASRLIGAAIDAALRRHDRRAYWAVDGVIVSSSLDASFLTHERGLAAERVGCITQAPAAAFLETAAPAMSADRLRQILHVGNFAYFKGSHALAAAIPALLGADPAVRITWVSHRHDHAAIRALIGPHDSQRLTLLDWMPQADLVTLFDRHGIFLCPSLFEGFAKVFLEAMARGLCVIATPTGGMLDHIRNGETGCLVGFHQPEAIVATAQRLIEQPALAVSMSTAAAGTARCFSWERVATETEAFYERLRQLRPT